jgi:hypothetical protein
LKPIAPAPTPKALTALSVGTMELEPATVQPGAAHGASKSRGNAGTAIVATAATALLPVAGPVAHVTSQ